MEPGESTSLRAKRQTKINEVLISDMGKCLVNQIKNQSQKSLFFSAIIIIAKEISLFARLKEMAESDDDVAFTTSSGWLKLLKNHLLHNVKVTGEAPSDDVKAHCRGKNTS